MNAVLMRRKTDDGRQLQRQTQARKQWRALDQSPMGSRLTPRLMRAPATSRRRARSVLVLSVIGRFFSFSYSTAWDDNCQSGMPAQSNALKQGLATTGSKPPRPGRSLCKTKEAWKTEALRKTTPG